MNDLKQLMRENVESPPPDHLDLDALLVAGRRRVRGRRSLAVGGAAALVAGVVATTTLAWPFGAVREPSPADRPPAPDAPTITLADAERAVEGRDYRVLASYTNEDLNSDNGQYFEGVTEDGQILFRDGPRADQRRARYALMDPATEAKDWLPDPPGHGQQLWPVELGTERLVLTTGEYDDDGAEPRATLVSLVFDRGTRQWTTVEWPSLPDVDFPGVVAGPDGRLYVRTPATQGKPPKGGWPTDSSGEADDADAEGDSYHLWSVSLSDSSDVRDEGVTVGDVAFAGGSMVWTDRRNGDAGLVHMRDLSTGSERSFDPRSGERCNLLGFGAAGEHIVMSQYCGTYAGGVRDDRVQVLSTDGDQVVTIQDSGVEGTLAGAGGGGNVVVVTSYEDRTKGTYAYDLESGDLLRISDSMSSYYLGGPTPDGQFLWHTAVNDRRGATQLLGELVR